LWSNKRKEMQGVIFFLKKMKIEILKKKKKKKKEKEKKDIFNKDKFVFV